MPSRDRHVVARLASGLVLRGTTVDFTPERPTLWITPDGGGRGVELRVSDLKALFFVPTNGSGETASRSRPAYAPEPDATRNGKRLVVRFLDGETMTGHALSYRPEKVGFFLFPDDPECQYEKIFVLQAATSDVLVGRVAELHPIASRTSATPDREKAA